MPKSIMIDIAGQRFGFLMALKPIEKHGRKWYWLCQCDCGETPVVCGKNLRNGTTKSCGCWKRTNGITHGAVVNGKPTVEYHTWLAMRDRCRNPNHPNFKHYGGRGIKVCKRWDKFENFLADMGPRPGGEREYSIERVNVNGHYQPSNCIWMLTKYQTRNQRRQLE